MAKERYQIKSECPECGCGLICNMTPDEYREKYGNIKDKVTVTIRICLPLEVTATETGGKQKKTETGGNLEKRRPFSDQ